VGQTDLFTHNQSRSYLNHLVIGSVMEKISGDLLNRNVECVPKFHVNSVCHTIETLWHEFS
jgi:hypothetical protein